METWSLADLGLSGTGLHGAALTRVVEVRKPEAKPPTERVENVGADEAVARIVEWLAARKLVA
jgi:electron transfer flavoprotein alpha/beta subunit